MSMRRRRKRSRIARLAHPQAKARSNTQMNRRDFLVGSMMASALPALAQARAAQKPVAGPMPDVQVLVFDTFGTVVDWRSAVIAEGEELGRAKGLKVDWAAFADAWRAGYGPSMNRVRSGQLPWTRLDD